MRRFYIFIYYLLYVLVACWAVKLLWPMKFINKKKKFDKGKIMLCNHLSMIDPIVHVAHYPCRPMFFSKKELSTTPLKLFQKPYNIIFVDRGNPDIKAVKRCLSGLRNGERLLLYPEGTRNRLEVGEMLELKNGAALFAIRCKTPLMILLVHHRMRVFKRNYYYAGEDFDLSEFYDQKPTQDVLKAASDIISQKLKAAREEMDAIMRQKYGHKKWYKKYLLRAESALVE